MTKIFLKITLSFFILLMGSINLKLWANKKDAAKSSLSFEKILLMNTLWSGSHNAAGLWDYNFNKRFGKTTLIFRNENGDFHRFQEEEDQNKYGFYTNGYAVLERWKFYGDFNYFGQKDVGAKWVDVLDPYNENPYIIGDKNETTYTKEYFNMSAKGVWQANNKLNLGFEINYQTGVGARRKDPRPENKATRFCIKPGIIYLLNKFNFGINLNVETSKENITFENVTDSTFTYYHFKGLGAFTSSQEDADRSHESTLLGGGLQLGFNGN